MGLIETQILEEQIYIPRSFSPAKPVTQSAFTPYVDGEPGGGYRKPNRGLWTSTLATSYESGWEYWCKNEMPHWLSNAGWVLQPLEARVLTIEGSYSIALFAEQYCFRDPTYPPELADHAITPDWNKISQEADAVRVTNPFHPDVRFGPVNVFYGWDCESTWWARWCFDDEVRQVALPTGKEANLEEQEPVLGS